MQPPSNHGESVSILGRVFKIRLLGFSNGCFLLVSEGGEEWLGSLTLSIKTHDRVEHTAVIPEMRAGVFASILADLVTNSVGGITIVSLYLKDEVSPGLAQAMLKKVRSFLKTGRKAVD